ARMRGSWSRSASGSGGGGVSVAASSRSTTWRSPPVGSFVSDNIAFNPRSGGELSTHSPPGNHHPPRLLPRAGRARVAGARLRVDEGRARPATRVTLAPRRRRVKDGSEERWSVHSIARADDGLSRLFLLQAPLFR